MKFNKAFELELTLNRDKYAANVKKVGRKISIIDIPLCLIINNIYFLVNGKEMKILSFAIMQIGLGYIIGILAGLIYLKYEERKFIKNNNPSTSMDKKE